MESAGKIAPQDWMALPDTCAVMAALSADGAVARFVGGCVRDAVLGCAVKDIDIATTETPEIVIGLLDRAGLRSVPTGIAHGTVTAIAGGSHFEITTLRHDVETFGRHARVAFTDDWRADAERRDFTMNAMFCDLDGTLYDPTGGLADLRAGRVLFVGDARARIQEDVLRLLRYFRFFAWYGKGAPDRDALAACAEFAPRLPDLSAERVWAETSRLLLAPDPAPVIRLMAKKEVLDHLLPEANHSDRLAGLIRLEDEFGHPADAIRRLAAIIEGDRNTVADLSVRLRLSRRDSDRLGDILAYRGQTNPRMSVRDQRAMIYRIGVDLFRDFVLIDWTDDGEDRSELWRTVKDWKPVTLPLKGADVIAMGVPKGPDIGKHLAAVEDWWIGEDFTPDRAACLARLGEIAA
jgi:poly(A) polymerase